MFFAAAHFLVHYALTGAYLLVGRDSAAFWPLFHTLGILDWPAELLSPLMIPYFAFPPAAAVPVAFASIIYSLAVSMLWLVTRPFIRWSPSATFVHSCRIAAFVVAAVLLSWLFFGVVCAFAGEFMLGILDVARYYPGEFGYSPVRLGLSIVLWALTIFATYKFVFAPRQHVIPATV
jgi:hypothetical protein